MTPTQEIKDKLDIVDFLRGYLNLRPAGRNFKANCPFHREKTPSFMVSPERQSWHCFGCGIGGDIFAFLMRHDNLEFGEALKALADKAGVELRRTSPLEYQQFGLLYDLNNAAKEFFKNQLANSPVASAYLKSRGLSSETIEEFELGFAPNNRDELVLHFVNRGHRPEDVVRAGLAIKTERGLQLDRFRGRIMFPIHNHLGKVVGFTGRVLPELDTGEMGKYVNSPETPIFNKSRLLYGFWKSKNHIRDKNEVFVTEGQMDFLMAWQSGIKNAIASSGTAFTADHVLALRRLTDVMVLAFDNDEAGWTAGERAIDLAEQNDFNVKVATLKGFKDPAEAGEKNPEYLKNEVAAARPAIRIYFERYLPQGREHNFGDRENLRKLRAVLLKINQVASPIQREFWTHELAQYTSLSESLLRQEAEPLGDKRQETSSKQAVNHLPETSGPVSRRELISRDMLAAALVSANFASFADHLPYFTSRSREAWEVLNSGARKSEKPELDSFLNAVILRTELMPIAPISELKEHLRREYVREKRIELAQSVRFAESKEDKEEVKRILNELNELPTV